MASLSIKERKAKTPSFLTPSKKYTMIEEFKDELKDFKKILNKIKELKLLRDQEINEIKNETKRKLNILDDEINDILDKLDVNLTTLELRCILYEKLHDFEYERIGRIKDSILLS